MSLKPQALPECKSSAGDKTGKPKQYGEASNSILYKVRSSNLAAFSESLCRIHGVLKCALSVRNNLCNAGKLK